MSTYTKATNFTAKDALASGNPSKIIRGSEFDTEFNAIATAIASKANLSAFAASFGATDSSIRINDTVILKWGLGSAAQAGAAAYVNTFATPFPTSCDSVIAIHYGGDTSVNIVVLSKTAANFSLLSNFPGPVPVAALWFAIGQ